jgi:hypothetical protein
MARIPILQSPTPQATGNATIKTPDLPAVTNAALGEGLMNIGQAGFKMLEMKKKADDITNVTAATLSMDKAHKDFIAYQQSPEGMNDDANWSKKWSEISSKVGEDVKTMALTPEARLHLESKLSNWSTNGAIRVQADVFKQSENKVLSAIDSAKSARQWDAGQSAITAAEAILPSWQIERLRNDMNESKRTQILNDFSNTVGALRKEGTADAADRIDAMANEMFANNHISEENYKLIKDSADKQKQLAIDSEQRNQDPIGNANKLQSDKNYLSWLNPDDRASLIVQSQNTLKRFQSSESEAIVNLAIDGQVKTFEDAKPLFKWSDPSQQLEIEKMFRNPGPSSEDQALKLNQDTMALIKNYDSEKDIDSATRAQIAKSISSMRKYRPDMADGLKFEFEKRIKDGKATGFFFYAKETHEIFNDLYRSGRFGDLGDEKNDKDSPKRVKALMAKQTLEFQIEDEFNKLPKEQQNFESLKKIIYSSFESILKLSGAESVNPILPKADWEKTKSQVQSIIREQKK